MKDREIFEALKEIRKKAPPELDRMVFEAVSQRKRKFPLLAPAFAAGILLILFLILYPAKDNSLVATTYIINLNSPLEGEIYMDEVPLEVKIYPENLYYYTITIDGETIEQGEIDGSLEDTLFITPGYHRLILKFINLYTMEEQTIERVFLGM